MVGVDNAHAVAVEGDDVLDCDVAFCLVEAVAAGLVEGACKVGSKLVKGFCNEVLGNVADLPKFSA